MAFDEMYELEAKFDPRESFYGKAHVLVTDTPYKRTLQSYNTKVAQITRDKTGNKVAVVNGTYSATTLRHIKEFLLQHGFNAESKAQIERDYA